MIDSAPDELRELPPSAKLVFVTLEQEGPLTQREVATESLLPVRTVRHALETLQEAGLVVGRPYVLDARKRVYVLTDPDGRSESGRGERTVS